MLSEKYPQIKKLFGYDPKFKWVVTGMVLIQFVSMFFVKDLNYPMLFLLAYCFGGVINHSLMLGMYKHSCPSMNHINPISMLFLTHILKGETLMELYLRIHRLLSECNDNSFISLLLKNCIIKPYLLSLMFLK